MDIMSGGDLESLMLRRGRPFCESDCVFYTAEVILGLLHLHQRGIVHRDLKVRHDVHHHSSALPHRATTHRQHIG